MSVRKNFPQKVRGTGLATTARHGDNRRLAKKTSADEALKNPQPFLQPAILFFGLLCHLTATSLVSLTNIRWYFLFAHHFIEFNFARMNNKGNFFAVRGTWGGGIQVDKLVSNAESRLTGNKAGKAAYYANGWNLSSHSPSLLNGSKLSPCPNPVKEIIMG